MSMDQESTPAQIETNKTEIDDAQTLKHETETTSENSPPSQTNKPEYDDSKALKHDPVRDPNAKNLPQAETQPSSENSPSQTNLPGTDIQKTSKQDAESVSSAKHIPQAETQPRSENSPSQTNLPGTDLQKTSKQDAESFSSAKNIPQAETQPSSENSPSQVNLPETDLQKTSKQDAESVSSAKNLPQAETQPSSENSPSQTNLPETDLQKTSKQDAESVSSAKHIPQAETQPSPENSPSQTNLPGTDLQKTSKQDAESVSSAKNIPQAETQPSSENSPSQTNLPETDLQKTSKQDAASVSSAKNIPQTETQTGSHLAPSSQINKPEIDDSKALNHDPESGPSAKVIPQTETQTSIKNSHLSETNKLETDDSKALKHDPESEPSAESIPKGETPTSSKHSPPPKYALSQTTPIAKDSATNAYPQVQPAKDETIPREASPLKNGSTRMVDLETRAGETLEQGSVKKSSNWDKLRNVFHFRKKPKGKSSQDTKVGTTSESKPSTSSQDTQVDTAPESKPSTSISKPMSAEKKSQIRLIQADISYVKQRKEELEHYNRELDDVLREAEKDFYRRRKGDDLDVLRKDMMKLKLLDPSKYKKDADEKDPFKNFQFQSKFNQRISEEVLEIIPRLHKKEAFVKSEDFKDFEARYNQLSHPLKLCLLCFSVFPEYNIIRKRLMVQWWVSEGFVEFEGDANENFNQLMEKGFIEPVNENRSPSVRCCKMHPFYRSALAMIARRSRFFSFNDKGDPTQKFSKTFQSCLVGEGLLSLQDYKKLMSLVACKENKSPTHNSLETSQSSWERKEKELLVDHLEKLHLLINVDEHILEFKLDWFKSMKNLNFLYLGRWKVLVTDHIEVEDTEFLDGLKFMSFVKLLSLQGISNIIALPSSILKMANLKILDLRACYNLETIPDRIDFLKNLEHLDMSECYLVEHMPKSLSFLKKLKVIKGFVVGTDEGKKIKCCTLYDLAKLEELIKLCIYTGLEEFPKEQHVDALHKFKKLKKLTITWGGSALQATPGPVNVSKKENNHRDNGNQKYERTLPPALEKLDLKCFPKSVTPYWLELENLKHLNLKKLYIRGGKLSDLGQYQNTDDCKVMPAKKDTWKVEVLRLKYLSEIKMEWRQLLELFPKLEYLEQVSCPKLTLFPSDANGVWINKIKTKGN